MRSTVIDLSLLRKDPHGYEQAVALARGQLGYLSSFYPGFEQWFDQKVEPGLVAGTRTLLMRNVGDRLAGIAVLKHDFEERKLCCLRVLSDFSGSGLGLRLFEDSFELLKTDRPLLSVCEEQLPNFQRVFNHFGFLPGNRYDGFYRKGVAEHSFNGLLQPTQAESCSALPRR